MDHTERGIHHRNRGPRAAKGEPKPDPRWDENRRVELIDVADPCVSTSYRLLLEATLEDLQTTNETIQAIKLKNLQDEAIIDKVDAWNWVFGDFSKTPKSNRPPLEFETVCEFVGIDPAAFRDKIRMTCEPPCWKVRWTWDGRRARRPRADGTPPRVWSLEAKRAAKLRYEARAVRLARQKRLNQSPTHLWRRLCDGYPLPIQVIGKVEV